ncbi:MAG: cupin domain-containing protein [bacterium]|nr:cupin domain-containing protein [bacterium]
MKIIHLADKPEVPASHEDPQNPGSFKRVLLAKDDLTLGRVQMLNWARLPVGKKFSRHIHEDMEEIFLVLEGEAKIFVGDESVTMKHGDLVLVPIGAKHWMENVGENDVIYLTIGISQQRGGRTLVS